ncbi:MAG TPA: pyridoxal-phosphate dependent enzyme, partial [Ktedonobacteraceae bacterium]|nr:pyridoxal-phosphate dependent enzyme [Ktedonobacteraceae bacterium]
EGCIEVTYAYDRQLIPPPTSSQSGMWRYQALLPIEYQGLYPLAVGGTPLIASSTLRKVTNLPHLWIKDETRSPTGSNKDRATALIVEHALQSGIHTISCASTGNVAVSLAFGTAAAGLQAVVFVPAHVLDAKLRLILMAGATVFKVNEGYQAAVQLSRLAAQQFNWYDRNTGYNALSLEAKKTVAFEIWEQLDRQVPDVVLVPVGDGVTISGIAKGFRELLQCGVTSKLPRLIGIQASGCQPVKQAWEGQQPPPTYVGSTIADGIAVTTPINAAMALRDVRETHGSFIAISDETILQAVNTLARRGGLAVEAAGVAAFAGIEPALAAGLFKPHETIVVLATGTGLKNIPPLSDSAKEHLYQINADLEQVARYQRRV